MAHRVLLVGHCEMDGPRLKREIEAGAPGLSVARVNDDHALAEALAEGADLLLVNREPVGFDKDGIELICEVRGKSPDQKLMLVSDRADAQSEAERAGAMPGFGKAEMGKPRIVEIVKAAVAR